MAAVALLLAACAGKDSTPPSGGDGGEAADGGGAQDGGADGADGAVPGPVQCADTPPAPLDCSPFWACFGRTPRECVAQDCPRTDSAMTTSEAFSQCVGDACTGLDPGQQQACAEENCGVALVECIADGDDDTCWSYEACIQRDCLPMQETDPPAADDEVSACLDRCLDDVATDRCRRCRGGAYSDFMEARCATELRAWRMCGQDNGCGDSACAAEWCPAVTETLETCLDEQVEANPDDLQERLGTCYEPAEDPAEG